MKILKNFFYLIPLMHHENIVRELLSSPTKYIFFRFFSEGEP